MNSQPVEEKLTACQKARAIAAQAFYTSFTDLLKSESLISEVALRDKWLAEMRKNPDIFPDGWYLPPPHGIGVLFGTEENYQRMDYQSLRPKDLWPRGDISLDRDTGIIYVYASPVDRKTGMIGDFGMTIYFGQNLDIKDHLKRCLDLNWQVLDRSQVGMTFADLTTFANDLFIKFGLSNEVISITDKSSSGVNIGHTIPASYEDWMTEELAVFQSNDWQQILKIISNKRKFLNTVEPLPIKNGMAFTIEQRLTKPNNPSIPMSSFHTIALIHQDGKKELLTNFEQIFRLVGMDYMF